jgi:diamine N-acetyltransferase
MTTVTDGFVRDAHLDDAPAISALALRTFRETYAAQTRVEDMDAFLDGAYRPEDISGKLVDGRHRYFVAEAGGVAVGYAHLVIDERDPSVTGDHPVLLAEIYLDGSHQGLGLGAALMQRAIDEARSAGADVLWLGVWEHNTRAQEFYRRWQFTAVGDMPFIFGSEQQRDIVMALPL